MKIAQLMTGSSIDFEQRKKDIQRREMGEAYKKTRQYQSPKNPMLEELENLLSGKTEKDLHATDRANRELNASVDEETKSLTEKREEELKSPKVQSQIHGLEMTEQEVIAHENAHKSVGGDLTGPVAYTYTEGPDNERYINGGEVSINAKEGATDEETLRILERVKAAALASAEPSPQDLRVAASATAQIQQTRAEIARDRYEEFVTDEEEPFADVDLTTEIPERFLNDFNGRDVTQESVFGKELESLLQQRAFQKATSKYSSHIAMVKNGYRPFDEPSFSKTA